MLKKMAALSFIVATVLSIPASGFAKGAEDVVRVEGRVVGHNKDNSTLTIRKKDGIESTVHYDASTEWTSQYHGEKKADKIDASQIKNDDYVICVGLSGDKGVVNATYISKRLSHSSK